MRRGGDHRPVRLPHRVVRRLEVDSEGARVWLGGARCLLAFIHVCLRFVLGRLFRRTRGITQPREARHLIGGEAESVLAGEQVLRRV